jgi:putative NIF3 family GTP cyclohydrolase 1 type 2
MDNSHLGVGSGIIGELEREMEEKAFLQLLKDRFKVGAIRHTPLLGKSIKRVAVCGGAGSFLIKRAIQQKADIYITGDVKYHEFFDADGRLVIADIGHYESEQFTVDLLHDLLVKKFPTFAVLKTRVNTNPVQYFT